jgi:uncharacterized protein (TIGR02145 family)
MRILKLFILISITLIGCKTEEKLLVKENPPTVITKTPSDISFTNATLNGEVTDEGFSATSDRGFVYSDKNTNPTGNDSRVQVGFGKGIYSVVLDKVLANTKYYYKAYATNTKGISFGEIQNFTTNDFKAPTVTTDLPINITYYSVDLGGSVTETGGLPVTQRGICYGLNPNPSITDNKVILGEGVGTFKINLNNLKSNLKYYLRAYAINSKGTGYGNEQSFNTLEAQLRDKSTLVVEVKSKTGRIWMDRNLGASQPATSLSDEKAFGDLYQWGRGADGHQLRTSGTTTTLSSADVTGNERFITNSDDWRNPQNDKLWQGVNSLNNPCPAGFRLPTDAEWDLERLSWTANNSSGAILSPLKLPLAGYRDHINTNGTLLNVNEGGFYWSSTVVSNYSRNIFFINNTAQLYTWHRAVGRSVRCIKD